MAITGNCGRDRLQHRNIWIVRVTLLTLRLSELLTGARTGPESGRKASLYNATEVTSRGCRCGEAESALAEEGRDTREASGTGYVEAALDRAGRGD